MVFTDLLRTISKMDTTGIQQDIAQILTTITRLHARLPRDESKLESSGYMLQRYLDELASYAESVANGAIDANERSH